MQLIMPEDNEIFPYPPLRFCFKARQMWLQLISSFLHLRMDAPAYWAEALLLAHPHAPCTPSLGILKPTWVPLYQKAGCQFSSLGRTHQKRQGDRPKSIYTTLSASFLHSPSEENPIQQTRNQKEERGKVTGHRYCQAAFSTYLPLFWEHFLSSLWIVPCNFSTI